MKASLFTASLAVCLTSLCLTAAAPSNLHAARPPVLKVEPELQPDPTVVKIIDELDDNQSAWLPKKNVVGDFNAFLKRHKHHVTGPRTRDYCCKWVWAADRKRAFFCGGNAGVPHKINDVWEYDLVSNTWVLLWEPDPDTNRVRHMSDEEAKAYLDQFVTVDKETGEIMTRRGAPFDPVHTWWALTYDPELHAMLWVMGNHHLHNQFLERNPDLSKDYRLGGFHKMRLWAYYPFEHRWECMSPPEGLKKSPAAILEYIPELGGSYYFTETHRQSGVFNSKTKQWEWQNVARSKNEYQQRGTIPYREAVAAYDSANKILVVHRGGKYPQDPPVVKHTHHYHVTPGRWEKVLSTPDAPPGHDGISPMTYDSVSGKCFISINMSEERARRRGYTTKLNGLWAYTAKDKTWTRLTPDGPSSPQGMACYNPEHNVLMIDPGGEAVWIYRCKKRK